MFASVKVSKFLPQHFHPINKRDLMQSLGKSHKLLCDFMFISFYVCCVMYCCVMLCINNTYVYICVYKMVVEVIFCY